MTEVIRHFAIRTALLALLLTVLLTAPAYAQTAFGGYMDEADAQELAAELYDAAQEQGICYGWTVAVTDEETNTAFTEAGSNFGPGLEVDQAQCPDGHIVMDVDVTWTANSSESYDSASVAIRSDVLDDDAVSRMGISTNGLAGDNGDSELYDAVAGLPTFAVFEGAADWQEAEVNAEVLPEGAAYEASPGSDWLRQRWWMFLIPVVLLIIAAVAFVALSPPPPGYRNRYY